MHEIDEMPVPGFGRAFTLALSLGEAVDVGRLATGGQRRHRPYRAGTLSGEELTGSLVSGGETLLDRPDGVTVVEAQALLRTDAGEVVRLIGTGYTVAATADAPFAGTRMTVVFEADEASDSAWLATRAFVAERPAGEDAFTIVQIV